MTGRLLLIDEVLSMTNANDTAAAASIQEMVERLGPATADLVGQLADPNMHTVDGFTKLFFHAALRLKEAQETIEAYKHSLAVLNRVRSLMGRTDLSEHDQHDLKAFECGLYPIDFDAEGKFTWDAEDLAPFKAV
jgi:hypothetical protein